MLPWLAQRQELFLLAGLGGRAGSSATIALADLARAAGLQTVALVTMPFTWEGRRREKAALQALDALLQRGVDTVVSHGEEVEAVMDGDSATLEAHLEALAAPLLQTLQARLE